MFPSANMPAHGMAVGVSPVGVAAVCRLNVASWQAFISGPSMREAPSTAGNAERLWFDKACALCTAVQVLSALAYIHSHGDIHRDVKAGNVLVAGEGQTKLGDFGVAGAQLPAPLTVLCWTSGHRQCCRAGALGSCKCHFSHRHNSALVFKALAAALPVRARRINRICAVQLV